MSGVEDIYRSEFRARVMAGRPRSLLEVGCGSGTFLRSVRDDILRLVGVDPDGEAVDALSLEGFEVTLSGAESLPFRDQEFDVVVFSFVPHHCRDWNAALKEAMRVARHSVEILDVWFDDTVPDQRVAHSFDRWCKEIDRRGGMVHNDVMPAGALLEPAIGMPGLTYDYVCRRLSSAWDIDEIEGTGRRYLAKAGDDPALAQGLEQILKDARRHGISEEGCVQMTIEINR
jgi:SAM-dependent methyltransferase